MIACPQNNNADAGIDAGNDVDSGNIDDAGSIDAGDTDAGNDDAGDTDAGDTDAGDVNPDRNQPPANGECRTTADCEEIPASSCRSPRNDPAVCGIPPNNDDFCQESSECGDGFVCATVERGCNGRGKECINACTSDSCAEDFICNEQTKICDPVLCDDGFACRAVQTCDPQNANADKHGCVLLTCTVDDDCPSVALCVEGRCDEDFGVCQLPVP